jgi:4-hydroxy-tetrahydrodipicolinate reductase
MAVDVVVIGATGRMGHALGRLMSGADDVRSLGGIADDAPASGDPTPGYPEIRPMVEAGDLIRRASVLIDFSAPPYLRQLLDSHGEMLDGRALVVGTTGLDRDLEERLASLAGVAAVLTAPNFSVGVNLLLALAERAARALPTDGYHVEIVETHHAAKADAPSGTALALGRAIAGARGVGLDAVRRDGRSGRPGTRPPEEIGLHALRGGDVIGEHTVHFLGRRERILLGHSAQDRDLFAEGALLAVRWVHRREPGRYGMAQVLGLET